MTREISAFRFSSFELPGDEAFEAWRQIMARMFQIDKSRVVGGLPRGGASMLLLGDVMANRSVFNAQKLSRDSRRVESTPDHLVFQLYLSGGFVGEIGATPVRVSRGQIAVCDLRRQLDVEAMRSNTIGLTVPRHLLDGVALDRLPARLDPARERLLATRIFRLHQRLPKLAASELPRVTADLIGALHRLLDPSACADALDGRELDPDRRAIAEQVMAVMLGYPDLSPAMIAEQLQLSRASLFRLFAPAGGVMQRVWALRLDAVRTALEQPSEPRTLSRLAADHGFKSGAHLSRSFRARFGVAPREWRAQQVAQRHDNWKSQSHRLDECWRALGQ